MKAIVLNSKSETQFHFGLSSLNSDSNLDDSSLIFHSDSLWSGLLQKNFEINESDALSFISWFVENRLRISSVFICLEINNDFIYFLPKPISLNLYQSQDRKRTNNIKFLSKSIIEKGIKPDEWFTEKCIIFNNEFVVLKEEITLNNSYNSDELNHTSLYSIFSIPKVKVRGDRENSFYHQTNIQLISNSLFSTKYYFLVDSQLNDNEWTKFIRYIEQLISFGIGGELSTGCGFIDSFAINDFNFNINSKSQFFSCSLAIPNRDENNELLLYKSEIRGGRRLDNEQKSKCVEMLLEGSIFHNKINGCIVDLAPESFSHPIKRCGMPLTLPLHYNYIFEKERGYDIQT